MTRGTIFTLVPHAMATTAAATTEIIRLVRELLAEAILAELFAAFLVQYPWQVVIDLKSVRLQRCLSESPVERAST